MTVRAALTGKHDTLVRRAPCQLGALRIHLTRLSTEGLGPRHGEVRRAHQMLNAALTTVDASWLGAHSLLHVRPHNDLNCITSMCC